MSLTPEQRRRALMVLELGHVYGVQRAEVETWLAARNAGTLDLEPLPLRRLTDLHAAFAKTGNPEGTDAECQLIREYETAARRADTAPSAPSCSDLDLDAVERRELGRIVREQRQLIARAKRLAREADEGSPDWNAIEGCRVELLSKRDQAPNMAARQQLGAAAYNLELLKRTRNSDGTPDFQAIARDHGLPASTQATPEPLELLAHQEQPIHYCARDCGQTVLTPSQVCQPCRNLELAPQGDQLGLFNAPRTTKAPQPDALFTTAPTGALF